jgi:4'-phosphopantetheinyl transferase
MSSARSFPKNNQIHLWLADIQQFQSYDSAIRILSADEAHQHSKFHAQRDRDRYLLTRYAVRSLLSQYVPSTLAADWHFQTTEFGKPSLAPGQVPSNLHFNISHSKEKILIAFSASREIGVDIEVFDSSLQFLELAEKHFSPFEVQSLRDHPARDHAEIFFRYWTLKEAFIKATGLGLNTPLDQFSFDIENTDRIQIRFHSAIPGEDGSWSFQVLRPWPETRAAVCLATNAKIELEVLSFT